MVYDRAVSDQGFLGTVKIKPVLVHDHTVDDWFKSVPASPSHTSSLIFFFFFLQASARRRTGRLGRNSCPDHL
jgi:hypothetical protein